MMVNVKRLGGRIVPDTVELYGETFWREKTIDAHFVELDGALERLQTVLRECEEYFDQRADADHNGVNFIANDEMRLLTEIREAMPSSVSEPTEPATKPAKNRG